MALVKIWFVLIFGILNYVVGQQFTPGCSFFTGKCVYNVQLGDQEHCNGNTNTLRTIDGSCSCNDVAKVSTDLNNLQNLVDKLQKSMMDFKSQLSNGSAKTTSFKPVENQKYLNLLNTLHTKDDLLNRTNEEVTNVLKTASTEIENLREKLKNTTSELATCHVSLGITHTSQTGKLMYIYFRIR